MIKTGPVPVAGPSVTLAGPSVPLKALRSPSGAFSVVKQSDTIVPFVIVF